MSGRKATDGAKAPSDRQPMPTSPGNEASPPEVKGGGIGGLAGVFRGLIKSPTQSATTSLPTVSHIVAHAPGEQAGAAAARHLPQTQMEAFTKLKNGSIGERIAAAKSLAKAVDDYPWTPVLEIWEAGKDLIGQSQPLAARQAGWELLMMCSKHKGSTDLERMGFFLTFSEPAHPDDFHLQLAALEGLADKGRDLHGFETAVFPLLTRWLGEAFLAVKNFRKEASLSRNASAKAKMNMTGVDKNIAQLFMFVENVIKFNFKHASDKDIGLLLSELCNICNKTGAEDDLHACIQIIGSVVIFGTIPSDRLKACIDVLSSILSVVENLHQEAWKAISDICMSHHGQSTVRICIETLKDYNISFEVEKDEPKARGAKEARVVRGSLLILQKLLSPGTEKGYPTVALNLLVEGLKNVATTTNPKVALDTLKLLNALFDGPDGAINDAIAEEDWTDLFSVATKCSAHATHYLTRVDYKSTPESVPYQVRQLINRIEALVKLHSSGLLQREECIAFLASVPHALPHSAASLIIEHFQEFGSCYPSEPNWKANTDLIIEGFYHDQKLPTDTRLRALDVATNLYWIISVLPEDIDIGEPDFLLGLLKRILARVEDETDEIVLQELVTFLVEVSTVANMGVFEHMLERLKRVLTGQRAKGSAAMLPLSMQTTSSASASLASAASSLQDPSIPMVVPGESLSNVVTRGYVQMFMRSMNSDAVKAHETFKMLVHIARVKEYESDARLSAMKLLFRLRADWGHHIYLTLTTDSGKLAASLYRTEDSYARKLANEAAHPPRASRTEQAFPSRLSRGRSFTGQPQDRVTPLRAVSGAGGSGIGRVHTQRALSLRLWSLPDPDALPAEPSDGASTVLFSVAQHEEAVTDGGTEKKGSLNIAAWLECVRGVLQHGSNWEVYSFVLVHLPGQLSNHPIFADSSSITMIQELRKSLCETIRTNSVQEPPSSSGLRKSDVANCLFQSITTLISYHPYFRKADEDDIVLALRLGLSDKTAKTCIHGLSIACHEIPMSLTPSLVPILHKMSQVITQPFVAMHILEFLACLSRLHSLYSNFREDEYRIVFGIAFRYLQYVRDKKRSAVSRHNSAPEASSLSIPAHNDQTVTDDLPQYVYALAYHVVTFWFLALRVEDRAKQIGWIANKLFKDVDGIVTDEEAVITMDFMQRVAFSDAADSVEDPTFTEELLGCQVLKKHWIIGNSVVSIKQALKTGLAEITRRFPSGISSFKVEERWAETLPHQVLNQASEAVRGPERGPISSPSHLLLQLIAPTPQSVDLATRPMLLQDDGSGSLERQIRLMDLVSTVDGHKVGVIYVGENQTDETEILANEVGSPEYHEFLGGLGTLTALKGAEFNTQGLDRYDNTDGKYTYCWRDRVTEIVFHITTQMPTDLENDPRSNLKKRHIGNDYVNIIYNDSGRPFGRDTFPSEFSYVYIVITPNPRPSFAASREAAEKRKKAAESEEAPPPSLMPFFTVQVMGRPGFPDISPASDPKTISLAALPSFVRLAALNASVFTQVWSQHGGEHLGSWRHRLQQIRKIRERFGPKDHNDNSGIPSPPASSKGQGGAGTGTTTAAPSNTSILGGTLPPGLPPQHGESSRPVSGVRDSLTSSIRRSSVATFFTSGTAATDPTASSHRASLLSTTTADHAEVGASSPYGGDADALIDSVDFSKWT